MNKNLCCRSNIAILVLTALVGCSRAPLKKQKDALTPSTWSWETSNDISDDGLRSAIKESANALEKSKERLLKFGPQSIKANDYAKALKELVELNSSKDDLVTSLKKDFVAMAIYGDKKKGQVQLSTSITVSVEGSKSRTEDKTQALWSAPAKYVDVDAQSFSCTQCKGQVVSEGPSLKVVALPSKGELEDGAAKYGLKELFYVNPVDAYFIQLNGSGVIKVGSKNYVLSYAGNNGEKWSKEDNQSVVFFKQTRSPRSYLGTKLFAGRTISLDSAVVPAGAMALLSFKNKEGKEVQRIVAVQNESIQVQGPGTANLYLGKDIDRNHLFEDPSAKLVVFFPKEFYDFTKEPKKSKQPILPRHLYRDNR